MAYFAYKGRNAGGQLVEGRLEAATSGAVADVLLGQGVVPVEIRETKAAAKAASGGFNITLGKPKVGHIDLLLFSRQLHTLMKAGVPILRALAGLQESAINPAMKAVI